MNEYGGALTLLYVKYHLQHAYMVVVQSSRGTEPGKSGRLEGEISVHHVFVKTL